MVRIQTDQIGDMSVVEFEGRIVNAQDAIRLYDSVASHEDARIIVLDLSEVYDMAAGGIHMLVSLQRWAHNRRIRLKLFNPSPSLRSKLKQANARPDFEIAPLSEMMILLAQADSQYSLVQQDHRGTSSTSSPEATA